MLQTDDGAYDYQQPDNQQREPHPLLQIAAFSMAQLNTTKLQSMLKTRRRSSERRPLLLKLNQGRPAGPYSREPARLCYHLSATTMFSSGVPPKPAVPVPVSPLLLGLIKPN